MPIQENEVLAVVGTVIFVVLTLLAGLWIPFVISAIVLALLIMCLIPA